jgi:nucleoside-diphosphate-sugar epimerase
MNNNWIVGKLDLILITGANGFVGSKLFEILLEYGFKRIRCLVRSNRNITELKRLAGSSDAEVKFIEGNLLSRNVCDIATKGASVIYHLAAGIEKSFPGCFMNSVIATRNILDAAIKEQTLKRFVNVSSIAIYSNEKLPRGGMLDESCEVDTKLIERYEPYTYGKAKQDELALDYAKKYNLPLVIVRPGVVFGPGKAKITDRIGTNIFGVFLHLGLSNRIPFTYIDNCAEAIVLAGLRKGIEGQVFNIIDDNLPSSREFIKLYKRKVHRFFSIPIPYTIWFLFNYLWEKYSKWSDGQLPPVFNRRVCSVYWKGNRYSNRKAKELLGWCPRVTMSEGLQRFFSYMREVRGKKN